MSASPFEQLEAAYATGGVDASLQCLADQLRGEKKYHELFESLKMQVRRRLGLPLLYGDSADNLGEEQRTKLEDGLIEACREVGLLLLNDGRIREGWMYLRPVGDRKAAAAVIGLIEANEENMEELVEVCLRESVDVQRGFKLVLESYGTCNAITTFEGELSRHPRNEQELCSGMLVWHLYQELMENLKTDIGRQEGTPPAETTLKGLVADRPWLFQELSYHVDTTHLSSVTRFARMLQDKALLSLALDMTEYGRRLHKQFQYEGESPFQEFYPSHALYFQAVMGENEEAAVAYFREKAAACDPRTEGAAAIEVYVDLLSRLGRYGEAIDASIQMMPEGSSSAGLAPTLIELSQKAGNYQRMANHCRERGDVLGFAAALVKATR